MERVAKRTGLSRQFFFFRTEQMIPPANRIFQADLEEGSGNIGFEPMLYQIEMSQNRLADCVSLNRCARGTAA
jgi:hypothetical protein